LLIILIIANNAHMLTNCHSITAHKSPEVYFYTQFS